MPRRKKPVEGIESVEANPQEEDGLKLLYMHHHGYISTRELLDSLMNKITHVLPASVRTKLFGTVAVAFIYFGLVTSGVIGDETGLIT